MNRNSIDVILINDEQWDFVLDTSIDIPSNDIGFNSNNYESTKICVYYKHKPFIFFTQVKIEDLYNCRFIDLE